MQYLTDLTLNSGQDRKKKGAPGGQAHKQVGRSKPQSRGEEGGSRGTEEPRSSSNGRAGGADPKNRKHALVILLLVLVPVTACVQ